MHRAIDAETQMEMPGRADFVSGSPLHFHNPHPIHAVELEPEQESQRYEVSRAEVQRNPRWVLASASLKW